ACFGTATIPIFDMVAVPNRPSHRLHPTQRTFMNPQELKAIMSHGLLSFPLTDFDAQGEFNAKGYAARLEWLAPHGASALFAAGGTGEFFSLAGDEYAAVIRT